MLDCVATKSADITISMNSSATTIYSKVINTWAGQSGKELPLTLLLFYPLSTSYIGSDPMQLWFDHRGTLALAEVPDEEGPELPANSSCPSIALFFGSLPDTLPAGIHQS
jgi:hypothetical protein